MGHLIIYGRNCSPSIGIPANEKLDEIEKVSKIKALITLQIAQKICNQPKKVMTPSKNDSLATFNCPTPNNDAGPF